MMERARRLGLFVAVGLAACNGGDEDGLTVGTTDAESADPESADDIVQDSDSQHAEPTCHNLASCCPAGTFAVFGTALPDEMSTSTVGRCQLSMGGADVVV